MAKPLGPRWQSVGEPVPRVKRAGLQPFLKRGCGGVVSGLRGVFPTLGLPAPFPFAGGGGGARILGGRSSPLRWKWGRGGGSLLFGARESGGAARGRRAGSPGPCLWGSPPPAAAGSRGRHFRCSPRRAFLSTSVNLARSAAPRGEMWPASFPRSHGLPERPPARGAFKSCAPLRRPVLSRMKWRHCGSEPRGAGRPPPGPWGLRSPSTYLPGGQLGRPWRSRRLRFQPLSFCTRFNRASLHKKGAEFGELQKWRKKKLQPLVYWQWCRRGLLGPRGSVRFTISPCSRRAFWNKRFCDFVLVFKCELVRVLGNLSFQVKPVTLRFKLVIYDESGIKMITLGVLPLDVAQDFGVLSVVSRFLAGPLGI